MKPIDDAVDTVIPSVVNLTQEQEALNTAVEAGIDTTNEIVGDPLGDYVDGLNLTSAAADSATASITNATEATRDATADIDTANERLRDFDDAFQLSEATIPRVTSAMREFTGTAPDIDNVTAAVMSTTLSVDDLLDSVEAVGDGTEHVDAIGESFRSLAEHTVPGVTRDIVSAFVEIAEGGAIEDAFGSLGTRAGNRIVSGLSDVLSEQLSDAVIGNLEGLSVSGIGGQLAGVASALAVPVGHLCDSGWGVCVGRRNVGQGVSLVKHEPNPSRLPMCFWKADR